MAEIKETAVQSERQSKPNNEIVKEIIAVLVENNLSVSQAREILRVASKELGNQKITSTYH